MKKNTIIAIVLLAITLTGCSSATQTDTVTEVDNEVVESNELMEESKAEESTEDESKALEDIDNSKITEESAEPEITDELTETEEDISSGIISDFEITDNGDAGLLVNYIYDGTNHEQIIDYAKEVGEDYYCMKYDFSSQIADVNHDGKDEVLINMYYANNVADGVCTSVVYAADDNGELYMELNINELNLSDKWYVYSDTTISEEGISLTGLWKNEDTFEIESDERTIVYENGTYN